MAGRTGAALIDGKRKRKYVYAKSEAEAVRKRDELRRQLQLGIDLTAQPRTVEAWLTEWLRDVKAHDGTRPPTLARYRLAISKHLVPGRGRVKLDRLTPRDVQRFLTGLRGKLSPASIIKVHAVLRVALADPGAAHDYETARALHDPDDGRHLRPGPAGAGSSGCLGHRWGAGRGRDGVTAWLYEWPYSGPGQPGRVLVEPRGLEPLTPALQRQCSAS